MKQPNALQKILHRFVMLKPVTDFFAPRVHYFDRKLLGWTKGRYSFAGILGWPVIEITTIGAKTHTPRTIPLVGLMDGELIALVASSFGREHNPAWYYNLKKHPQCDVRFNGRTGKYIAREAEGEEYDHYWRLALSYYAGYEKYKERASHRNIPLILLEPKK